MYFSVQFLDKICDQVSDAVLDAHLAQDPNAKVACGMILVCCRISKVAASPTFGFRCRSTLGWDKRRMRIRNGTDRRIILRTRRAYMGIKRGFWDKMRICSYACIAIKLDFVPNMFLSPHHPQKLTIVPPPLDGNLET